MAPSKWLGCEHRHKRGLVHRMSNSSLCVIIVLHNVVGDQPGTVKLTTQQYDEPGQAWTPTVQIVVAV